MPSVYEIRSFKAKRLQSDALRQYVLGVGKAAVEAAGGVLFAAFHGHIGVSTDEGIVITRWKDGDAALRHGRLALAGCPELVDSEPEAYMEATLRPAETDAGPTLEGVYALRWFHLDDSKVKTHVSLSGKAWPSFEGNFKTKVIGLFKAIGGNAAHATMLLCTNYESMAEWERSRMAQPASQDQEQTKATFRQRSAILHHEHVIIYKNMLI